jgi:hypothetical protein
MRRRYIGFVPDVTKLRNCFFPTTSPCYRIDEIVETVKLTSFDRDVPCKALRGELSYAVWILYNPAEYVTTLFRREYLEGRKW